MKSAIWNIENLENAISFLILFKYNSMQIQKCQHCYSKCSSKDFLSSCTKFAFINAIAVSFFLLQLSFVCNPAFYFNMGKSY